MTCQPPFYNPHLPLYVNLLHWETSKFTSHKTPSYCWEISFLLIKTSCQISQNTVSQPIKYSISLQINYLHHTSALQHCCEMIELMGFVPTQTVSNNSAAIRIIIHPHVFVQAHVRFILLTRRFSYDWIWSSQACCALSTLLKHIRWPQMHFSCWEPWVLSVAQIIDLVVEK